jgi:hypothetical protein
VIAAALLIDPDRQRLDAQIKGHDVSGTRLGFWGFIDKAGMLVAACIPGNGNLSKAAGWNLG